MSLPSFYLCNARSILPKMDDFLSNMSTFTPDCGGVTETWLNSNISDDFLKIPSYNLFRCDRQSKRGGGVCLWSKNYLMAKKIKFVTNDYMECILVHSEVVKMLFVLLYIPPSACSSHVAVDVLKSQM